jgi:hypothetical protein
MDGTPQDEILQELQALREENAALREQITSNGTPREFFDAFIGLLQQMREDQARLFESWRQHSSEPLPEPAIVESVAVHRPGKLAHPEWATYVGIRDHLRALETEADLPPGEITQDLIAGMAGVHPRTLHRRLVNDWGLDLKHDRDWPPSRMPEQPRKTPRQGRLFELGHTTMSIAAAAPVMLGLDLFADGRVDHIVRWCNAVVSQIPKHL